MKRRTGIASNSSFRTLNAFTPALSFSRPKSLISPAYDNSNAPGIHNKRVHLTTEEERDSTPASFAMTPPNDFNESTLQGQLKIAQDRSASLEQQCFDLTQEIACMAAEKNSAVANFEKVERLQEQVLFQEREVKEMKEVNSRLRLQLVQHQQQQHVVSGVGTDQTRRVQLLRFQHDCEQELFSVMALMPSFVPLFFGVMALKQEVTVLLAPLVDLLRRKEDDVKQHEFVLRILCSCTILFPEFASYCLSNQPSLEATLLGDFLLRENNATTTRQEIQHLLLLLVQRTVSTSRNTSLLRRVFANDHQLLTKELFLVLVSDRQVYPDLFPSDHNTWNQVPYPFSLDCGLIGCDIMMKQFKPSDIIPFLDSHAFWTDLVRTLYAATRQQCVEDCELALSLLHRALREAKEVEFLPEVKHQLTAALLCLQDSVWGKPIMISQAKNLLTLLIPKAIPLL